MGALGVVLLLPSVDDYTSMRQAPEPVEIQTLVAELAVEAFDMGILRGLARLNEVQRDAVRIGPSIQDLPSELRAIVHGDLLGRPVPGNELVEHPRHPLTRQGGVNF